MITDQAPSPEQVRWANRRLSRGSLTTLLVVLAVLAAKTALHATGRDWLDWFSPVAALLLSFLVRMAPTIPPGRRRTWVLITWALALVALWATDIRLGTAWSTRADLGAVLAGYGVFLALMVAGLVALWPVRRAWNEHAVRRAITGAQARGVAVPV